MRVSCMQDKLNEGIGIVSRVVPKRSTLPVLSNIYLSSDGDGMLRLSATDLKIGITTWIDASIDEEGSTTLPAKLFSDLVKQSPSERIGIELNPQNQEAQYHCGSINAVIKGIEAQEYPSIATADNDPLTRMSASLLREVLEQASFAAATDESRPILTGVLMSFEGEELVMAAADGFRLSVRTALLGDAVRKDAQVVVPANALKEVARVLTNPDELVSITVTDNENQILFRVGQIEIVSQLLEGAFPDVQRLVPSEHTTRIIVDSAPFFKAVRRADIFARDAAHIIRITATPSEPGFPGTLTLSAEASELGGNKEEMVAIIEGDAIEIAFNAQYLLEVLKVLDSAQVALEFNTANAPGVVRAIGTDGFTHVIMPMHISR